MYQYNYRRQLVRGKQPLIQRRIEEEPFVCDSNLWMDPERGPVQDDTEDC